MGGLIIAKPVNAAVAEDKKDVASRVAFAEDLGANGLTAQLMVQHPDLLAAAKEVVAQGVVVGKSAHAKKSADLAADLAGKTLVEDTSAFDPKYDAYVVLGEKYAKTPAELASIRLKVLVPNKYEVATPLGLTIRPNPKKEGGWIARIKKAPGMKVGILQISDKPSDPASWKETQDLGLVQKLDPLAAGEWAIRAAHRRGRVTSSFTAPVFFTVK